ncbi:MAG: MoaD/ThiS family protein [Pseudomonadota bacterium]
MEDILQREARFQILIMAVRKGTIRIKVRLFAGLDTIAKIEAYNPSDGVTLDIPKGIRLRKVAKMLGLSRPSTLIYFMNGERIGPWHKLKDGDEIDFFRPVAGG